MAINTAGQTLAQSQAAGVLLFANGSDTYDATAITTADFTKVTVGFRPRYVCFINVTDRIRVEWWEGMAADTCIKTAAAGTVTIETTNQGITVAADSFQVSQNATLAVIAASKVTRWHVLG